MTIHTFVVAATTATALMATAASAADCAVDVEDPFDLEAAQINEIYDCLKDAMAEGYAKEGDEVASNFRSWTVSSTRPAVAGAHGNRLLQTFANDIAAEQYLKFAEEGVKMPVGSVLAKESITISKKKKQARIGPLFIMTKMEDGAISETADWLYAGIQPNGKVMKIKQSFCHDCHASYADQDMLAYPLEEVRVGN
ncbi:Cytochrome P460 [Litoreibacter ascidiaceicola]|uniref:Cytochrome P460 n=1 Tax=Litoreibacter ascidiaceicola TaxID=1486859 RepID=A0A1M4XZ73_9RHOB|nr:cytochrome P460 family protein [Litoreibacter ascidiaceicola]SHE98532.1 Cytochrome P460 [Litoreibacter ascidiaceicola]